MKNTLNTNELAKLSGVTTRTLRYYDKIGLLKPAREENGYRAYSEQDVDLLQQILLYREMGFALTEIKGILSDPDFDYLKALCMHLENLKERRMEIDLLINNVKKSIENEKGEITMSTNEKFEGFKKKLIDDNEKQFGKEARSRYGDQQVDMSNAKMMNLSEEEYKKMEKLSTQINEKLENAVKESLSPTSKEGIEIAQMHKEWLAYTWSSYSPEAHEGLAEMYVHDERFTVYYDRNVPGCAEFLRDAIKEFVRNK